MQKPRLSSLSETTVVLGACAVVLLVGLVFQFGLARGLMAVCGFAGFAALFCAGIGIAINAILRTKPSVSKLSWFLLIFGALASIAASFWNGKTTLTYAVVGIIGGLFVGAVSGARFRFKRKP
jgi:hypothetical protein